MQKQYKRFPYFKMLMKECFANPIKESLLLVYYNNFNVNNIFMDFTLNICTGTNMKLFILYLSS